MRSGAGAVNRRWRQGQLAVAGFVVVGAGIGFVVIPAASARMPICRWTVQCAERLDLRRDRLRLPSRASGDFAPGQSVSWDPAIMQVLADTDTARGARLAGEVCAACHGDNGLSASSEIPSLAGQSSYAIYKQLHDYRTGARAHPQMTDVAKRLAVSDLASIAAFYAAASKEYTALGSRQLIGREEIARLAWEGDTRRRIPARISCHTNGVGGPIETPTLVAKSGIYGLQLNAYAAGTRKNDVTAACATSPRS